MNYIISPKISGVNNTKEKVLDGLTKQINGIKVGKTS
jgi:hypothetical protein